MNNVQKLIDELANRNLTIGSVESFTGGLFAKTFTDVSGASKVFKGSIVAYSPEVKVNVVGIPQEYIDIKNKFANETRLGEGTGTCFVCEEGTDVGTCFMCIVFNGQAWPIPLHLQMERNVLREYCVEAVISTVLSIITQSK